MKTELHERQCSKIGTTKKERIQTLKDSLKGVQRVPSLLLSNPTQSLEDINLHEHQILDCEPLHDLKGHLSNLFEELPSKMNQPLAGEVKAIIETDLA